ncbi:AP-5 complex subunit sigma-1-like [Amphiura filiformis]|uniref:AP-5 complex subunit sigma-1-like n=1 Tax=Amphiura filiformis TaxID=82378 RepID=UPI003B211B01
MVHAFIVHTMSTGICRVLHTSHFGLETMPSDNTEVTQRDPGRATTPSPLQNTDASATTTSMSPADPRLLRKEEIALICRQAQSEYTFRKAVSERPDYPVTMPGMSIDDMMFGAEIGSFRLATNDPYQTERIAIWLGIAGTGFTFVCDKHENRQQAEAVLKLLARYLQEYTQALTLPENVLLKSDRVATVVHYFLPCGRLLFMNHTVIKQLEKDMEIQLRAK